MEDMGEHSFEMKTLVHINVIFIIRVAANRVQICNSCPHPPYVGGEGPWVPEAVQEVQYIFEKWNEVMIILLKTRNRDAEAKLMGNEEGWEVGTWYGHPIYKVIIL